MLVLLHHQCREEAGIPLLCSIYILVLGCWSSLGEMQDFLDNDHVSACIVSSYRPIWSLLPDPSSDFLRCWSKCNTKLGIILHGLFLPAQCPDVASCRLTFVKSAFLPPPRLGGARPSRVYQETRSKRKCH